MTPILTTTGTVLQPIRIGKDYGQIASAIVFLPDGKTAYVLSSTVVGGGAGTVTPIRIATNTALAPITVPAGSFSMAMTPDGTTLYVLDLGSSRDQEGMVVPIRTATSTALRPIPIGHAWPTTISLAITPDSRTAYVANAGTDRVIPIRTATNQVLGAITIGNLPSVIAITPAPRR